MELVLIAVVAVVLVAAVIVIVRRREPDTVDSFRRQIDALSPEARRPVVDQVQQIDETDEDTGERAEAETTDDGAADEGGPADEGGRDGT